MFFFYWIPERNSRKKRRHALIAFAIFAQFHTFIPLFTCYYATTIHYSHFTYIIISIRQLHLHTLFFASHLLQVKQILFFIEMFSMNLWMTLFKHATKYTKECVDGGYHEQLREQCKQRKIIIIRTYEISNKFHLPSHRRTMTPIQTMQTENTTPVSAARWFPLHCMIWKCSCDFPDSLSIARSRHVVGAVIVYVICWFGFLRSITASDDASCILH